MHSKRDDPYKFESSNSTPSSRNELLEYNDKTAHLSDYSNPSALRTNRRRSKRSTCKKLSTYLIYFGLFILFAGYCSTDKIYAWINPVSFKKLEIENLAFCEFKDEDNFINFNLKGFVKFIEDQTLFQRDPMIYYV